MHPNRIFAALHAALRPDAITIADGGDILSFARMGLPPRTYLDSGTFGCLGVGVPYGVAAALLHPDRQVVVVSGDGAFGINAMEIDSAKRHGAKAVFIVANNAAWNIERLDQEMNYGGRVVGTTLQWSDYAAMARAFGLHAERVTDPGATPCRPRRGVRESAGAARRRRHAARAVVGRRQGIGLGPGLPGAHVVGRRGARPPFAVSHLLTVADVVAAQARLQPDKIGVRDSRRDADVRAMERARDAARQRARGPRPRQRRPRRAARLQLHRVDGALRRASAGGARRGADQLPARLRRDRVHRDELRGARVCRAARPRRPDRADPFAAWRSRHRVTSNSAGRHGSRLAGLRDDHRRCVRRGDRAAPSRPKIRGR